MNHGALVDIVYVVVGWLAMSLCLLPILAIMWLQKLFGRFSNGILDLTSKLSFNKWAAASLFALACFAALLTVSILETAYVGECVVKDVAKELHAIMSPTVEDANRWGG